MKEEDRQRIIRLKLARQQIPYRAAISTGFPSVDNALGIGGLPRGRIVEIFGPPSCGKSTLALQIAARLQQAGATVVWIDAERVFDPGYAASLGANTAGLPVILPASAEQALEIAATLAASDALDLLVIDSAAALVPKLELETGLGESGVGLQARVLASGLRRLSLTVARTATSVVFLNQLRARMGVRGEDSETSAGGAALKLYAAARIVLYQEIPARRIHFRVLKNITARAFAEGILEWEPGRGFIET